MKRIMALLGCIPASCFSQSCVQRRCRPDPHLSVSGCPHLSSGGPQVYVLRALLAALSAAALFTGVSHNLPLSLDLKLIAGAVFTGVCAVGGACSSSLRCSLLLTFPMMLGSRGRAYILLLLLTVLHTGPLQNVQRNVEAAALSLSCNLDLQLNTSRQLWRQTLLPVLSIAQELTGSSSDFEDETLNISRKYQTFREEAMRQYGSEPLANNANAEANDTQQQFTTSTMMQCDGVVQEAVQRCSDWFDVKWTDCMSTISVPVLNQILCVPMKFSFLCDILRVMTPWCRERLPVEGNLGQLWDQLNQSMNQFSQEFRAQLVVEEEQEQSVIEGSLLDQTFMNLVQASILRLTSVSEVLLEILQIAKSCTFISIIIQALMYLVNYRRDLRFDNIYITSYFRQIETRRKAAGQQCVLPLTDSERSRFIQPCSPRIHPQEAPQLVSGLVQVVSLSLLCAVLVSVDLVLFHVMDVVSRNTVTHYNITGVQQVDLRVGGASIMARLLRKTVSAFNSSAHIDVYSSNRECAVQPLPLSSSVFFSCAACVLMVALCSCLQLYTSRLRRVICASYHPQREKRRVLFLYNLLLQNNRKCPAPNRKHRHTHTCRTVCGRCFGCCRTEDPGVHYETG